LSAEIEAVGLAAAGGGVVATGGGRVGFLLQPAIAKTIADDRIKDERDSRRRDRSMRILLVRKYPVFR
jgi:glycine/D-amino acid oxidase-like deaminating enzyme